MELAKVTSKGQITVPSQIRKKLKLRTGDKVVFTEEDGKIVFRNASLTALSEIQEEMRGEAEGQGIRDDQDVVKLVKQGRKKRPPR
jgi:antitoxin PrlF